MVQHNNAPDHGFGDTQGYDQAAGLLALQVESISFAAAERIGNLVLSSRFSSENQSTALEMYQALPGTLLPEFWVTDRPEKVFPSRPIYAVTSSLALETPLYNDDVLLWAPIDHPCEEVHTHRGLGLRTFSTFMSQLGLKLGRKDECLWLGSKVDGEQFAIEDSIARRGADVDAEIISMLFGVSDVDVFMNTADNDLHLHSELTRVIASIAERRENIYDEDPESRKYIDLLLDTMHRTTGVREGWYNALENTLKYSQYSQVPMALTPSNFTHWLIEAIKSSLPITKASQAIVLEVDPLKIFQEIPIYVFPLSTRPPGAIIPAPLLPAKAVTAIYAETSLVDAPERFRLLQKPLGALATSKWLADGSGKHVTPSDARDAGVNPVAPLCATRYAEDPVTVWAKHVAVGNIVPWWEDALPGGQPNGEMMTRVLEQVVSLQARSSDVLQNLALVAESTGGIEKQLLRATLQRIRLRSVRSVKNLEGAMLPSYYAL